MHNKERYTLKHLMSSLLMLFMLAWLTVCLPFVNESQCATKAQVELTTEEAPEADDSNPFTSTNEEKSEGGSSMPSEYLHNGFVLDHSFFHTFSLHKYHPSDLYTAFHPEMFIPPPEA
jgi:hypothetical protein